MNLKIQKTLELLPKNNMNIGKSMREAGYSDSTSRSGTQYRTLRKYTQDMFDSEKVKRELNREIKRMKKEKDNSSFCRLFEIKTKIAIPELRKTDITTNQPTSLNIIYTKDKVTESNNE